MRAIRWVNPEDCVRQLARTYKLIDPRAADDGVYRSIRPFSCGCLQDFGAWNVGKQRSAEWSRAKLIHLTMQQCSFVNPSKNGDEWTVRRIMKWCRYYGYSPSTSWTAKGVEDVDRKEAIPSTYSMMAPIPETGNNDDDIEVDVELVDSAVPKQRSLAPDALHQRIFLSEENLSLNTWIVQSIEAIGFKLRDEVDPGLGSNYFVPYGRQVMSQVWSSFLDDLVRRSYNEAWKRCSGGRPETITVLDVVNAIRRRPEFDLLTNDGLAVHQQQ